MFQGKTPITDSLNEAKGTIDLIEKGIGNIGIMLAEAFNPKRILKDAVEINNAVAKMTTTVLGQGRVISDALSDTMAQARIETLKFGLDTEQNIELFSKINEQLQNTRYLTTEQIVDMGALASIAGLTADEMAKFVVNFDTLGLGIDKSIDMIDKLQREARGYGINVGQFMKTVGENIKLVASYNFKGGIDGLAKMVAQAQSLRIDMGKTVSFAEDLLDPSKAIEIAAGFQMLGGAVGALGDPFQLLHMAQTDIAGLQDSLVDMASASATFNEETGEFDIPVTEMYRLREAAKLAGMGYQEFSEMALNSAKKTKKLEFLEGLTNIPEEQKELVANLGELKGGRLQISIPGVDGMKDVAELTGDEINKLSSLQEDMGKSEKQLAAESVGHLQQIENSLKSMTALPEAAVFEEGGFMRVMDKMSTSVSNMTNTLTEKIQGIDFSNAIGRAYENLVPQLKQTEIEGIFNSGINLSEYFANKIEAIDFDNILKDWLGENKINEADFNATNTYFTSKNFVDASQTVQQEETKPARDLVVTSQGESFQTAVDDYIFAISEQNLSNLTDTISKLSTVGQMVNNNQPMAVNISGDINLKLEGIPVNSEISKETIANLIRNNPQAISVINKQLNNTLNTYGGYV